MPKKPVFQVTGIDEMESILKTIAPANAAKLIDQTIGGTAREITKVLKQRSPGSAGGQLQKSIRVKKRRTQKGQPQYDIIFDSKKGGFFWRFFEHGTQGTGKNKGMTAQPFVEPLRLEYKSKIDEIIKQQFSKRLVSMIKRDAKRRAKNV